MGYEEPPYYHMTPDMYHDWNDMTEAERMRDVDRINYNRMGYSGSGSSTGISDSSSGNFSNEMGGSQIYGRDSREGKSGQSRRGYMESKEIHKGNTAEDKQMKMKELEKYTKELAEDVTEMISDASTEEKQLLKAKMQTLLSKIQ